LDWEEGQVGVKGGRRRPKRRRRRRKKSQASENCHS
jgi:hypothetical protein